VSGYLQRLVSTAIGTDSSVRPLMKPMFSPSASQDAPALSPQRDNATLRDANNIPPEVSAEFADVSTKASAPVHALRQAEGEQQSFGETQLNEIPPETPQPATTLTFTNCHPLFTFNGPQHTLQAARPAEPALRDVQPSKKRTQGEQSRGPTASSSVYVPLLNAMPDLSRSDSINTETATYAGARISQQKDQQLSAPAVKNGSDEIQIHIGRIEVTAVPPPAAAPKPKRGAKGPSLHEYLGRRDRRVS
jgi:hypothetical protein